MSGYDETHEIQLAKQQDRIRTLEAEVERCALCGHEWRRHDPEDGLCDAPSEDQRRWQGVCPCGRTTKFWGERNAFLSRQALEGNEEET